MRKSNLLKTNPLFFGFDGSHDFVPAYSKIKPEHFEPALDYALEEARRKINAIKKNSRAPSFKNTIRAFEQSKELFDYFCGVFAHLSSVQRTAQMEALEKIIQSKEAAFKDELYFDAGLFKRIKHVLKNKDQLNLDIEDTALLEAVHQEFYLNGAATNLEKKKRIYEINQKLSQLSSDYDTLLLQETNKIRMIITDPAELEGIPADTIENASALAKKIGHDGKWAFDESEATWFSVMLSAKNRTVRKLYHSLCIQNPLAIGIMKNILTLRHERSGLIGFQSHAELQFANRMVGSKAEITHFLDHLKAHVPRAARQENNEVRAIAKEDGIAKIEAWDEYYYEERLRERKLGISDDILKPYFQIDQVMNGVLELTGDLYDLEFVHDPMIDKWHPDVESFTVFDKKTNQKIAILQIDPYARPEKWDNAWCTSTTSNGHFLGKPTIPVVIVAGCVAKSTGGKPTLLSHDDVRVMFHEMGHATHAILSKSKHQRLSCLGNIKWDFVELPSQIHENWAMEPHILDRFARHYQTGERIPDTLKDKIHDSRAFMGGNTMAYSLKMTYLDLLLHSRNLKGVNLEKYEYESLKKIFPGHSKKYSLTPSFQHAATAGYDAGYYSYIWSEALDADGYEPFMQNGAINRKTAMEFKKLLEAGSITHPAELFRNFRGRDVDPTPLLRRYGLIESKIPAPGNDNTPPPTQATPALGINKPKNLSP